MRLGADGDKGEVRSRRADVKPRTVGAKGEIHKIIRRLAKEGLAVLLISSDLPEALGMSDRIGVMRGGTIAAVLPGGSDAPTVMAAALGTEKGAAA